MLSKIVFNIHWLLLILTGWSLYTYWDESQIKIKAVETEIADINEKIERAKKDELRLKQYMQNVEEAKNKIEKTAQEVERLQRQFPAQIDDFEINEYLSDLALKLNIKNVTVKAEQEENKGFYFAKRFSFKGIGTYLQYLILLEKIEDNPRILNIISVKFQKGSGLQKSRFQLIDGEVIVETYRHNSTYKEAR